MPRSAVSTAVDGLVAACEQFSSALDMASTLDFTAKFEGAFGDIATVFLKTATELSRQVDLLILDDPPSVTAQYDREYAHLQTTATELSRRLRETDTGATSTALSILQTKLADLRAAAADVDHALRAASGDAPSAGSSRGTPSDPTTDLLSHLRAVRSGLNDAMTAVDDGSSSMVGSALDSVDAGLAGLMGVPFEVPKGMDDRNDDIRNSAVALVGEFNAVASRVGSLRSSDDRRLAIDGELASARSDALGAVVELGKFVALALMRKASFDACMRMNRLIKAIKTLADEVDVPNALDHATRKAGAVTVRYLRRLKDLMNIAEPLDEREEAGLVATGKSLLWPLVDVINQTRRLVTDGVVPADPDREELCAAIEGHTEVLAAATAAANEALAMSHAVALEESEALSVPTDDPNYNTEPFRTMAESLERGGEAEANADAPAAGLTYAEALRHLVSPCVQMSKALNFVYPSAVRVRHKLSKSCMALRVALTRVVEKAVIAGSLAKDRTLLQAVRVVAIDCIPLVEAAAVVDRDPSREHIHRLGLTVARSLGAFLALETVLAPPPSRHTDFYAEIAKIGDDLCSEGLCVELLEHARLDLEEALLATAAVASSSAGARVGETPGGAISVAGAVVAVLGAAVAAPELVNSHLLELCATAQRWTAVCAAEAGPSAVTNLRFARAVVEELISFQASLDTRSHILDQMGVVVPAVQDLVDVYQQGSPAFGGDLVDKANTAFVAWYRAMHPGPQELVATSGALVVAASDELIVSWSDTEVVREASTKLVEAVKQLVAHATAVIESLKSPDASVRLQNRLDNVSASTSALIADIRALVKGTLPEAHALVPKASHLAKDVRSLLAACDKAPVVDDQAASLEFIVLNEAVAGGGGGDGDASDSAHSEPGAGATAGPDVDIVRAMTRSARQLAHAIRDYVVARGEGGTRSPEVMDAAMRVRGECGVLVDNAHALSPRIDDHDIRQCFDDEVDDVIALDTGLTTAPDEDLAEAASNLTVAVEQVVETACDAFDIDQGELDRGAASATVVAAPSAAVEHQPERRNSVAVEVTAKVMKPLTAMVSVLPATPENEPQEGAAPPPPATPDVGPVVLGGGAAPATPATVLDTASSSASSDSGRRGDDVDDMVVVTTAAVNDRSNDGSSASASVVLGAPPPPASRELPARSIFRTNYASRQEQLDHSVQGMLADAKVGKVVAPSVYECEEPGEGIDPETGLIYEDAVLVAAGHDLETAAQTFVEAKSLVALLEAALVLFERHWALEGYLERQIHFALVTDDAVRVEALEEFFDSIHRCGAAMVTSLEQLYDGGDAARHELTIILEDLLVEVVHLLEAFEVGSDESDGGDDDESESAAEARLETYADMENVLASEGSTGSEVVEVLSVPTAPGAVTVARRRQARTSSAASLLAEEVVVPEAEVINDDGVPWMAFYKAIQSTAWLVEKAVAVARNPKAADANLVVLVKAALQQTKRLAGSMHQLASERDGEVAAALLHTGARDIADAAFVLVPKVKVVVAGSAISVDDPDDLSHEEHRGDFIAAAEAFFRVLVQYANVSVIRAGVVLTSGSDGDGGDSAATAARPSTSGAASGGLDAGTSPSTTSTADATRAANDQTTGGSSGGGGGSSAAASAPNKAVIPHRIPSIVSAFALYEHLLQITEPLDVLIAAAESGGEYQARLTPTVDAFSHGVNAFVELTRSVITAQTANALEVAVDKVAAALHQESTSFVRALSVVIGLLGANLAAVASDVLRDDIGKAGSFSAEALHSVLSFAQGHADFAEVVEAAVDVDAQASNLGKVSQTLIAAPSEPLSGSGAATRNTELFGQIKAAIKGFLPPIKFFLNAVQGHIGSVDQETWSSPLYQSFLEVTNVGVRSAKDLVATTNTSQKTVNELANFASLVQRFEDRVLVKIVEEDSIATPAQRARDFATIVALTRQRVDDVVMGRAGGDGDTLLVAVTGLLPTVGQLQEAAATVETHSVIAEGETLDRVRSASRALSAMRGRLSDAAHTYVDGEVAAFDVLWGDYLRLILQLVTDVSRVVLQEDLLAAAKATSDASRVLRATLGASIESAADSPAREKIDVTLASALSALSELDEAADAAVSNDVDALDSLRSSVQVFVRPMRGLLAAAKIYVDQIEDEREQLSVVEAVQRAGAETKDLVAVMNCGKKTLKELTHLLTVEG